MILPVTLSAVAAAVIVNIWLGLRVAALRRAFKVSIGDGGHEPLSRRMRAQLNFAENVPITLLLIAVLEIGGIGGGWLAYVAGAFILARVAHGFGMDGGKAQAGRVVGVLVTIAVQLLLAGVAVGVMLRQF
ncbi:MAPEG family protein [Pelagerythrobacter marinus]|uniref:MAPEG family protein n=1 Tax=Pelagerythrobacter marinus TaxID=538382 RepID=UPI002036B753|nr:MAPEG family protein [Pelagerythrobacter marinus]USA40058.1 MAPEG family protein [Pelagerythrobacter marinus]WPZ05821.1 MAPEG family protein [Pelagerythrobacter marinus]